jgi:hypothetical protein
MVMVDEPDGSLYLLQRHPPEVPPVRLVAGMLV